MLRSVRIRATSIILFFGLVSSGCAVTLMSPYDEKTEDLASSTARKMWTQFEQLRSETAPACLYSQHLPSYREIRVDLTDLATRSGAIDLNRQTKAQVDALQSSWVSFEKLHQAKEASGTCLTSEELSPVERALQSTVGSIIKLELEKKERR